jgi:hypothetical protein
VFLRQAQMAELTFWSPAANGQIQKPTMPQADRLARLFAANLRKLGSDRPEDV